MATITKSTALFPAALTAGLFNTAKGHSTLAILSAGKPIPFAGTDTFVFSMDGEVAIVGEGEQKPAGDAGFKKVTIKPIKVVYQHRVTDEFLNMSEEAQLPYMEAFTDGFAKKIARGLDIMAMHGLNPATKSSSPAIANNCFAKAVKQNVNYTAANPDDNIDDAVGLVQKAEMEINGVAMAPTFAAALGKMKTKANGTAIYPEYRFGGNPGTFGGLKADNNSTVSFNAPTNKMEAIVGDFANAFRWGYASQIPMEIIQYGDPDGQGDLKRNNQICLRAEAYIGWGILAPTAFATINTEAA